MQMSRVSQKPVDFPSAPAGLAFDLKYPMPEWLQSAVDDFLISSSVRSRAASQFLMFGLTFSQLLTMDVSTGFLKTHLIDDKLIS